MKINPSTVSPWALHRRLYDWVLSFAHSKYATLALFCMSFAESSFFPVAPDILQIALTLERRDKAWFFAGVNAVGSVLGGIFGYAIGALFWQIASPIFFKYVFSESTFNEVDALYHRWDSWIVFIAAFTPLPYKVITIAAGAFQMSLPVFIFASALGRSARFFLVATLLWHWGPPVKVFIDKYFNLLSILFVGLLFGAFILLKYAL